ncbi:spermatogenesis-associated protein 22 isoform X2 [Petromyzon marinus]|uniref:spermatogenesis-associated protein 22 isoform X2 n=1 Tax=Petromyzon marinus TaxID=7757 RepID=UPI003F6EE1F1
MNPDFSESRGAGSGLPLIPLFNKRKRVRQPITSEPSDGEVMETLASPSSYSSQWGPAGSAPSPGMWPAEVAQSFSSASSPQDGGGFERQQAKAGGQRPGLLQVPVPASGYVTNRSAGGGFCKARPTSQGKEESNAYTEWNRNMANEGGTREPHYQAFGSPVAALGRKGPSSSLTSYGPGATNKFKSNSAQSCTPSLSSARNKGSNSSGTGRGNGMGFNSRGRSNVGSSVGGRSDISSPMSGRGSMDYQATGQGGTMNSSVRGRGGMGSSIHQSYPSTSQGNVQIKNTPPGLPARQRALAAGDHSNTVGQGMTTNWGLSQSDLSDYSFFDDSDFTNSNSEQPAEKRMPTVAGTRAGSKLVTKERTVRVLTATVESMKHWSQYSLHVPLLFELFATLDSAVAPKERFAKVFTLKDGPHAIRCIFYETDRELPRLTRGLLHRCVGRFDQQQEVFQCFSIRPASAIEKDTYLTLVSAADYTMQLFVANLREP